MILLRYLKKYEAVDSLSCHLSQGYILSNLVFKKVNNFKMARKDDSHNKKERQFWKSKDRVR